MSGAHELEPAPASSPDWARQVQQRLRRLENPQSIRVGNWVLIVQDGVLTANRPGQVPIPLAGLDDADQPAGTARTSGGLPVDMPEQWWESLWNALSGGTSDNTWLDQLSAWLDDMWASIWSGWTTIPAAAIVSGSREMLWDPDFTGSASVDGGTEWVIDEDVYLDDLTGPNQRSVKLVMDGAPHSMRSNAMNVAPGQVIDLTASIAVLGLTVSGGTPIGIGVAFYDSAGVRQGTKIVASRGSVTGPIVGWVGLDAAARTANLSGSYTVPATGVVKVAMVVQVGSEATGGVLNVDKTSMRLGGLIPQSLVDGLSQAWEGLFSGFGSDGQTQLNTAWNNLLSMFGLGKPALVSGGFNRDVQLKTWGQDVLGPLGVFLTPEFKERWADITHSTLIYLFGGEIDGVAVSAFSQESIDNMTAAWAALKTLLGITDAPDMSQFWTNILNPFKGASQTQLPWLDANGHLSMSKIENLSESLGLKIDLSWLDTIRRQINGLLIPLGLGYLKDDTWQWAATGSVAADDLPAGQATTPAIGQASVTGLTGVIDNIRRSLNYSFGRFGLGYLDSSWQWTAGQPGAGDLPASGFNSIGGAPNPWISDILGMVGIPTTTNNDLPSQLDSTIPAAPVLLWPSVQASPSTSVPQASMLYYVATVVNSTTLKESAPSNEVMTYISGASIIYPKAQVTVAWWSAPPAGHTISLYRRTSTTGQYRRVASGVTGANTIDRDATTTATTQPGSAAASAAGVISAIDVKARDAKTAAGTVQAGLYGGTPTAPNPVGTAINVGAVPDLTVVGAGNNSGVPAVAKDASDATAAASIAARDTQAVADGIHQVVYGGNATGTPIDTAGIVQALQQFPQQNIAVNTNAGSTDPITFDAAAASGASTAAYTGTSKTITWTMTVGASANYLLIGAVFDDPENVAIATFSATATSTDGLVNVPLLQFSSPNDIVAVLMGAFVNPGDYTITFTVATENSATWDGFAATSVSYNNVNSVGVGGFNHGGQGSTALSLTTGQTVDDSRSRSVVLFVNSAASSSASALSAMTGATQRTNKAFASKHGLSIAIGDIDAAPAKNTFGMTAASASGNSWVVAEILLQAPDPDVGSFGRLIRVSTTPVTLSPFGADSSGVPPLPANTFDTAESLSADLKAPNMNCFQVTLGGQYWVRGRYAATAAAAGSTTANADGSIDGTVFVASMYVVVNGIIRTFAAAPTTAGSLEYQTVVDLKPGDIVSVIPGGSLTPYHTTAPAPPTYTGTTTLGTPGSWQLLGDSKWFTVMEIALANRSLL